MSKQYDDTDRGALFKNQRKESDRHPDYTGQLNVGGDDYRLSAWIKTDKNGAKYMSLSVKPKDEAPKQEPAAQPVAADAFDDDIPF